MPKNAFSLAEQNLSGICGERETTLRLNATKRLWMPDGIFIDAEGVTTGQHAIAEAAGALLARYPEYDFRAMKVVDSIPGVFRLQWAFGSPDLAPALSGVDVVRIEAEKIVAVYRFIDGAAF